MNSNLATSCDEFELPFLPIINRHSLIIIRDSRYISSQHTYPTYTIEIHFLIITYRIIIRNCYSLFRNCFREIIIIRVFFPIRGLFKNRFLVFLVFR